MQNPCRSRGRGCLSSAHRLAFSRDAAQLMSVDRVKDDGRGSTAQPFVKIVPTKCATCHCQVVRQRNGFVNESKHGRIDITDVASRVVIFAPTHSPTSAERGILRSSRSAGSVQVPTSGRA